MKTESTRLWLRPLWSVAAALALGPAVASAEDLASASSLFAGDGHWREVDRIEGVWNAKVTITRCDAAGNPTEIPVPSPPAPAPFAALAMFGANGTFHDTNQMNPGTRSSAFGTWQRTGYRSYRFAFKVFNFNPNTLSPLGSQIVRHDVVLAVDGRSYTSKGTSESFDTLNNLTTKGCSISTATRFR